MQNTKLIGPVANYIAAANAHDIEAVTATFSEAAAVRVETLDVAQVDGGRIERLEIS
jgi:hypothetical protein